MSCNYRLSILYLKCLEQEVPRISDFLFWIWEYLHIHKEKKHMHAYLVDGTQA
jgi:hypothetical protein